MKDFDKRCPKCRVRRDLCFCDQVHEQDNKNFVSLIVHVRELSLASNTAVLCNRVLKNSELLVRGAYESPLDLSNLVRPGFTPLYLYPDDDAIELNDDFLKNHQGPFQIIVPDGSWRQAKKFKKREPVLQNIQSVKIKIDRPSEYVLRMEPNDFSLCTFEAVARALGVLEDKNLQAEMERVFRVMVDVSMKSRKGYIDTGARYQEYLEKHKF